MFIDLFTARLRTHTSYISRPGYSTIVLDLRICLFVYRSIFRCPSFAGSLVALGLCFYLSRVISAFLPVCVYYMYLCAEDAYVHPTPHLKKNSRPLKSCRNLERKPLTPQSLTRNPLASLSLLPKPKQSEQNRNKT